MSTLCTNEDHGDLSCVPVAGQAQEIIVHRLEADLILQAEDEHHCVDPGGELKTEQMQVASLPHKKQQCHAMCSSCFCTDVNVLLRSAECEAESEEDFYTHH